MQRQKHTYQAYFFILPLLLFVLVFTLYPALTTFYYGFTEWNGIGSPEWTGLRNVEKLFSDGSFHAALKNIAILALYVVPWTVLPLLVAAAIREPSRGVGFFRSVSLIPFLISPVILGVLFRALLRTNGPINSLFEAIGLVPPEWLSSTAWPIHVVALATLFKFFGFGVLLYIGAMGKISESLYDSAKVDGCSPLQTLMVVTVPGIRHTIEFFIVLGFITYFARMFPIIHTMTGGGPGYASFVPEFGIYFHAFQNFQLGYSSTWAVFVNLLTFMIVAVQIALMRSEDRGKA